MYDPTSRTRQDQNTYGRVRGSAEIVQETLEDFLKTANTLIWNRSKKLPLDRMVLQSKFSNTCGSEGENFTIFCMHSHGPTVCYICRFVFSLSTSTLLCFLVCEGQFMLWKHNLSSHLLNLRSCEKIGSIMMNHVFISPYSSNIVYHIYSLAVFISGYIITNSQHEQLSVGLTAQLVEHYTGTT